MCFLVYRWQNKNKITNCLLSSGFNNFYYLRKNLVIWCVFGWFVLLCWNFNENALNNGNQLFQSHFGSLFFLCIHFIICISFGRDFMQRKCWKMEKRKEKMSNMSFFAITKSGDYETGSAWPYATIYVLPSANLICKFWKLNIFPVF